MWCVPLNNYMSPRSIKYFGQCQKFMSILLWRHCLKFGFELSRLYRRSFFNGRLIEWRQLSNDNFCTIVLSWTIDLHFIWLYASVIFDSIERDRSQFNYGRCSFAHYCMNWSQHPKANKNFFTIVLTLMVVITLIVFSECLFY